jgi:hydroxymethylpyrimidine/phosphomethylpyrimidine kinase
MKKNLVSIAGYDPSGGAGVLLDIRVFERLGFRGFGVLTAVTVQSPERVDRVLPVAARGVTAQFGRLAETYDIAGIKVGMLATAGNLTATARILGEAPRRPRVVDPVLLSSSGAVLLGRAAWPRFLDLLEGRADLITPNLEEAGILTGRTVGGVEAMRSAAERIWTWTGIPCLVKGGHLQGRATDILYDGRVFTVFEHRKQARSVHGTGCFLSSAILAYLIQGRTLKEACGLGIEAVGRAIRAAEPAGGRRWVFDLNREWDPVPEPVRKKR